MSFFALTETFLPLSCLTWLIGESALDHDGQHVRLQERGLGHDAQVVPGRAGRPSWFSM